MNKIGILTFYNACNYGAFLQAKALKEYFSALRKSPLIKKKIGR